VKPGDLVEIIDYGGYYSTDPLRIGILLKIVARPGMHDGAQVLTDGSVYYLALRDIRPVNSGGVWYDSNNKER